MKQKAKKWILRLTATGILIVALLIAIVLNPSTLYANKTAIGNVTIYHNTKLENAILIRLTEANELLKGSEVYDANFKFDLCLNDGSVYPAIIKQWQGNAFAWGFYHQVVLNGEANFKANYIELNGHRWHLSRVLAHEAVHCLQFNHFGLLQSNPAAGYPLWKWEGYPEYLARKSMNQPLAECIAIYTKSNPDEWGITLDDGTSVSRNYYGYWLLVRYCLDVKKMSYEQLLKDGTSEDVIMKEMIEWNVSSLRSEAIYVR